MEQVRKFFVIYPYYYLIALAVPIYGDPRQSGVLGPYEDTSSICRACIKSGAGTNDDSFYCTFTIVAPVPFYKDPGGGSMRYVFLS